jgi:hypothetical protein
MTEFKEAIRAGGGKITYHFDASTGIAFEVSGFMRALYFVALSMDGRQILCAVPAGGVGHTALHPRPSVLACIQSDQQSLWGRNCPRCEKYFRTNHVVPDVTYCPYCAEIARSVDFVSKDQRIYGGWPTQACFWLEWQCSALDTTASEKLAVVLAVLKIQSVPSQDYAESLE